MISSPPPGALARHWSLIAVVTLLCAQAAFVIWTAARTENHAAWSRLIIFPMWPPYGDLRGLTQGWDDVAAGLDPLREGKDQPRYNQPRLWLLGAKLGLGSKDTTWLGSAAVVLFLAAVGGTIAVAPGWTRLLPFGILASPPLWLALERGNSDLLVFALLTPALLAVPRPGWRAAWSQLAILLAAMLKLFPIVCLAAEWRAITRGRARRLAVVALVFGGYLAVTYQDVQAALRKTEYGTRESYGVNIAADKLQAAWSALPAATPRPPAWLADKSPRHMALRLAVLLLTGTSAALAWRSRRQHRVENTTDGEERAARLFLAGAAVYLATFLIGLNWAYRLLFLLWAMPRLARDLHAGDGRERAWAGAALSLIIFVCWQLAAKTDYDAPLGHLASIALLYPLARRATLLLRPASPPDGLTPA